MAPFSRTEKKAMIPKLIHQIWIGDTAPPLKWMRTWEAKHPGWDYVLWDNERVGSFNFKNKKHIEWYWKEKVWHGVADLMRYELLHAYGGFMAEADSVCIQSIDKLFAHETADAFSVYESEEVRPGLISPLLACTPRNEFAEMLIHTLHERIEIHGEPWKETGNRFMQQMVERSGYPRLKIFPSHYFIPEHYTGACYRGPGPVYAKQMWGTTKNVYHHGRTTRRRAPQRV